MDSEPRTSVQLFMANMAFEMFRLLMLNENLFVIKISVTIPEITAKDTSQDIKYIVCLALINRAFMLATYYEPATH